MLNFSKISKLTPNTSENTFLRHSEDLKKNFFFKFQKKFLKKFLKKVDDLIKDLSNLNDNTKNLLKDIKNQNIIIKIYASYFFME